MLEVAGGRDIVDKLRIHVELLECIKASMQGDEGSWATSKKLEREWVAQKASHRRALYPKEEELIRDYVRIWNTSSVKKVRATSIVFLSRRTFAGHLAESCKHLQRSFGWQRGHRGSGLEWWIHRIFAVHSVHRVAPQCQQEERPVKNYLQGLEIGEQTWKKLKSFR